VLGKAYRKTKKVLKGDDSDEEWPTDDNFFPSEDKEVSTDEEVKFIKKTKVQAETVLSSSEDDDDPEVEILGVKRPNTNFYAILAPTAKEEDGTEDDEEEENDKDADEGEAGDNDHPMPATQYATKFGYEDSNEELSSDEEKSKDEGPSSEEPSSSEELSSSEESSTSDNESTSDTYSHNSKNKQKKNKNNKNSRGYQSASNKNNHKKTIPSTKPNKTNVVVPNKATSTKPTGTPTLVRSTFPNKPTPFRPPSSNKADLPKTPVSAPSKFATKKTPQPVSSNKLNRPKTPGTTLSESSAKKTVQKDTSRLVQSNLMNMFNKVAHTADNIKSVVKDPRGKTAPDKMEKETLPSLLHDGSESKEETPMKPPAISSDASDPNDDWDTYTEDATTMVQGKQRKQRKTDSTKKRNKTKQTADANEGWSDLEVSEADLDISDDEKMTDATNAETETGKPMPRESRFTKGISKADRKFIRQQRRAGSEMSDKDLIAASSKGQTQGRCCGKIE
jgi:hypothetical protein